MDPGPILGAVRGALERRAEVRLAYLHGSAAEGSQAPGDVDVAVLLSTARDAAGTSLRRELALREALEEALPGLAVDLTILNEAPLALQFEVLRKGLVAVARDEEERVDFEASVMAQVQDRHYYERRRDAWLLDRVRRRGLA